MRHLRVDLQANTVCLDGQQLAFGRARLQLKVLCLLADGVQNTHALYTDGWGLRYNGDHSNNAVYVTLCRLRHRLQQMGMRIERSDEGFVLSPPVQLELTA